MKLQVADQKPKDTASTSSPYTSQAHRKASDAQWPSLLPALCSKLACHSSLPSQASPSCPGNFSGPPTRRPWLSLNFPKLRWHQTGVFYQHCSDSERITEIITQEKRNEAIRAPWHSFQRPNSLHKGPPSSGTGSSIFLHLGQHVRGLPHTSQLQVLKHLILFLWSLPDEAQNLISY